MDKKFLNLMRKQRKRPKNRTRPFNPKKYVEEELQSMNALVEKPPNLMRVLKRKTEKLQAHIIKKVFFAFGKDSAKNEIKN